MNNPIIFTERFDTTPDQIWQALTNVEAMKKWYFDVQDFVAVEGNDFYFYESGETREFLHRCKITRIEPPIVFAHTWSYPDHSKGSSLVTWEIMPEDDKTLVRITHDGVENFADGGTAFLRENFAAGWEAIMKNLLRNYLYHIQKLVFNIEIKAEASLVWKLLWNPESYTEWTSPFCEGSYYKGELAKGERVQFLVPLGEGMYSDIEFVKENELMILKHIGYMSDFKEIPLDEETRKWTGAFEIYRLKQDDDMTRLTVEVDTLPEYMEHMNEKFPLSLQKLKAMAENRLD